MSAFHLKLALVFSSVAMCLSEPSLPAKAFAEAAGDDRPAKPQLIDDFETLWPWSNESADDFAKLTLSGERVTVGERSMRVDFEAFGRQKFQVRRDGMLDLSGGARLLVDVYNAAEQMRLALGLETGRPPQYYESGDIALEHGWNRNVSFDLTSTNYSLGDGAHRHRPQDLGDTVKVLLLFYEDGNAKGTVYIDNLRLAGPRTDADNGAPTFRSVHADRNLLDVYERIELTVELEGRPQDGFDRDEIDVSATFFSPAGRKKIIQGFYDGANDRRFPGRHVWKVRFVPREPGPWIYEVTVTNPFVQTSSGLGDFMVRDNPSAKGFVRISRDSPDYFEFDNGEFFYPIGQNVAWASNMAHYMEAIRRYGGNTVRIWLSPWHLPIEERHELGRYDLAVARQLDAVMELARLNDLRVILVLYYHGITRESWGQSPYNADNGGPCLRPEEFFTNPKAIELAKKRAGYLAARIASSTHLMAWELFNEANFTAYWRFGDVVEWHRQIGEHLREADPYGHLVTTSAGDWTWRPDLLGLSVIDFLSPHLYRRELGQAIDTLASQAKPLGKPVLLGEFAGFPRAVDVRADRKGVYLHAGLWYTFTTPWAGSALSWWWDTHIEADNLYHHLRALARVAEGEDRRGHDFRVVESILSTGQGREANVRGIASPSLAYVWIFDEDQMNNHEADAPPVVRQETALTLYGMRDGSFDVEVWDTWTGERLSVARTSSTDGRVEVAIPPSQLDLLLKVKSVKGVLE